MRIPHGRRWMFYVVFLGGGLVSPLLSRIFGGFGMVVWVLVLGCFWMITRQDQARGREPRREDGRVQSRFGKVTGQTRTEASAQLALARLATFLDRDERFRLDHVEDSGLRATRWGNTITGSYPLAITVRPVGHGGTGGAGGAGSGTGAAEVEIVSDPPTSVPSQEEDTVRIVEDLLDVIDLPVGGAQETVGQDADGASTRTPETLGTQTPGTRTPETQTPEDGEDRSHE